MVKNLAMLALLASVALAVPAPRSIDGRTFDPAKFGIGSFFSGKASTSIIGSAGFSTGVAGALEACAGGAASGSADAEWKASLAAWLKGAGASFFEASICNEMVSWCTSSDASFRLSGWVIGAVDMAFMMDASVMAAGGWVAYFNAYIEDQHKGSGCACSTLADGAQGELGAFIKGSVGGALDAGLKGALQMCAAGGVAASLSASAQAEISSWLSGDCGLSADLIATMKGWLSTGTGIAGSGSASGSGTISG